MTHVKKSKGRAISKILLSVMENFYAGRSKPAIEIRGVSSRDVTDAEAILHGHPMFSDVKRSSYDGVTWSASVCEAGWAKYKDAGGKTDW